MIDLLTRQWWVLLLRGLLAIAFGVACFAIPGITLSTLVLLFGAFAMVDGIFLVVAAARNWQSRDDHWLLLLTGLLGIGIGIVTFRSPAITAVTLLLYISAWSLASGVMSIIAAIRLRKEVKGELWLAMGGVASIIFAALFLWNPVAGALSLLWVIGAYAMVIGTLLIALSIEVYGVGHRPGRTAGAGMPT
jgi:uncharacterized membrane protein HdeD (DUF308 family)